MKYLILLATFALAKGQTDTPPVGKVTCYNNHTVDITISNVFDLAEWNTSNWQLAGSASCKPSFGANSVTYTGLVLPDCAKKSLEVDNNVTIKYVLEINVTMPHPGDAGQLRAYNHLYYVSCTYDNQNMSMASFEPAVNKDDNDSAVAFFTFTLDVFTDADLVTALSGTIALNEPLFLWAQVVTQSDAPNLDLFPVECWASSSADPTSTKNKVTLITNGGDLGTFQVIPNATNAASCGSKDVSKDYQDTLKYNCTDNSVNETFSIRSFRFFGFAEDSLVYFHCDLRVCLAALSPSACECPSDAACYTAKRKRRSVGEYVTEFHAKAGPYYIAKENEKEEDHLEEQDKPQSVSTNLAIIVAVSGVVVVIAIIVCVTVFLIVRSRNKRRQSNDLNVVT